MFFKPLTLIFMLLFFLVAFSLFIWVEITMISVAFSKIGISPRHIFFALFAILVGSLVNIPVKRIPQDHMVTEKWVSFFGFRHFIPVHRPKETVLAVNVGGALIPAALSVYLLDKSGLWLQGLGATAIMTLFTYLLARPIKGIGIVMPAFLPPIMAAILSVILSYDYAPSVAYISGTLGTLIGADLLNLGKIKNLGAPVASIGGAGTFDGIFLTGIMAVVLAVILT